MNRRAWAASLFVAHITCAAAVLGDITNATLQIQGVSLEVETVSVTTGVDISTTIQTKFAGKKNDEAPAVEGLLAVAELTGPGLDAPIQLTTAPGHRFQVPGFSAEGVYFLQNIRLMKGSDFVAPATPSVATITVANLLQTSVKVHQLTPDELRARGIIVDGRNFDVYEYSFSFLINGQTIEIPFPVIVDPRTHEVTPIRTDTPFSLPPTGSVQPPRWSPPDVITFELPADEDFDPKIGQDPLEKGTRGKRPSIPAAIVIPNSFAVLHQFFAVLLTVSNGAPSGSTATLDDVRATIKVPAALRTAKSNPTVAFGQPVPIVDAANGVTFLIAQARGEAEWTLEGLSPGTHTVDIEVRATLKENGQVDIPLKATPRASIVVHDPRFNITFSHPDTVRKGIDYSTYSFITNTSAVPQTIRVGTDVPSCDQVSGANVCRVGNTDLQELTLGAGEMRMLEHKLRPGVTGSVFATAGTVDGNISAAVQLHMGVSESGIPLSPATLVLPYYAQFLPPELIGANLQLLGLGYSLATAPVTQATANLPRVIKTDVFYRAVDLARAGQQIFIASSAADRKRDALANLPLDLLGNSVELREWDELRRVEKSGRIAGASVTHALQSTALLNGTSIESFVDSFASATAHRDGYLFAVVHGPSVPGNARPYAVSLRGVSGNRADVANEADGGWIRDLPFADIARLEDPSGARAGEIAIIGRWTEATDIVINPAVSGLLSFELLLPGTDVHGVMRAHFDVKATAGQALHIPITPGAITVNAVLPSGGIAATAATIPVTAPALSIVAARQDLYLDPEGHKVSVLFNRPISAPDGVDLRSSFSGVIDFNRDGVIVKGPRPIFAAALQDGHQIVNLAFDHVLTTNAAYTISVSPIRDPLSNTDVAFAAPVVPKIDNDRPAGILYGKFLKGDNSAIPNSEVRLYTGHYRGCRSGLFDEPAPDCNPYKEAPQYATTEADGSFLFEYVPRDPIADQALTGGYRLLGVDPGGRFTILDGAVRLPGRVHFVNLQLLGRGAAEGFVRYANGERVASAKVYVGSTMFSIGRSATTNATGFYHVDDLPVGPITFSATDVDGNVAYASGEIATPGQLVTKDILIYRKPFPGTGSIFGVVRRSDTNAPVAGARVGVFSQGYGLTDAFTDAEGRFDFRGVPAGFVTLLAAEWSIARESAAIDFDLKPDEVRQIDLTLSVQQAESRASVSGDVVRENPLYPGDSSKYERVSGTIVRVGGRPPVTSDSSGRFTVDNLPLSFGNSAEVKAYDPSTKRIGSAVLPTLTEAGPNNVTIFIPANSYGNGTIRVQLINAAGVPTSGFRVIEPGFPPTALRQLGTGVYEYPNAPVGSPVEVWAVNGPAQYGDQFAQGSARLEFPGQIASMTLRLPGQGKVRVSLQSDIAVIGDVDLSYEVWDEAEQGPGQKTVTLSTRQIDGTAGFAMFSNVPALQQYSVSSTHPSYGYASANGTLAYDGDLTSHTLQLNRLSTIRGTVYAIDGMTPVAGASVRLNDGRRDTGVQVSQPDGSFAFFDVPAAITFTMTADATQSGIYRTGVAYGRTPATGGPGSSVSIIMRRRGSVEGRVVYANYKRYDPDNPANNVPDDTPDDFSDNAPVPLAKLWLRELDFPNRSFGSAREPLTADVAGRFAVSNVFVGSLRASAWDAGNQELRGDWTGSLHEEGEVLSSIYIAIGSGGTGAIVVTVVDPNQQNAPVENAEVGLYRGGLFDLTSSDGTGTARFEQVPVGTYSISAYSKALGKSGGSTPFAVAQDATSSVRITLEFSGEVDGTLADPESEPAGRGVPGVAVTLSGVGFQSRASTDPAGAFAFDGVREGLFTLDAKDTESNRRATASHTLSAADPHPIVNLELERTETLHVAVYLPDDAGGNSGVLAGPVTADVAQRCSLAGCDFHRTLQGNPITMPKLFARDQYGISVTEIGGAGRTIVTAASFPIGTAADPLQLVYRAFGDVNVTVMQSGTAASGARVRISGGSRSVTLVADASGTVVANGIPLGDVSVQAVSIDGGFSGSASGRLQRQAVPLALSVELGAYAGVTGLVEAEAGGASIGTRVLAAFGNRTLEMLTDFDGRYTFQGIPTQSGGTAVVLTYIGPDGVTIGARQTTTVFNDSASKVVALPTVRLDATPPQLLSITPDDGAANVSPDTAIRFVFSEPIRADQISNGHLQLVPADGSGQVVATFDPPSFASDGTVAITMRPPPPPPGQLFPLKSNTLYRIIVSGSIEDLTGHRLPAPRGTTFTTADYTEPRIIKTIPAVNAPVPEQVTFQFIFNEPIDPAPWQQGGGGVFHLYKISAAGAAGQIVAEKPGPAYLDPTSTVTLNFAPDNPIESDSFYRVVFSGIRDLQGNALVEQTLHFFSFDRTKPFVRLLSPVPDGFALVSGVEYQLVPDIRNGAVDAQVASDVAFVDYLRVDGAVETYVATLRTSPFAYKFVAPEAPVAGSTLTLRAMATDLSGNVGDPATITWTVKPNAAPSNLAVSLAPASAYPSNSVSAHVTFDDEGTFATAQVVVHAARLDGSDYSDSKTKQVTRGSVADPWPAVDLPFTLPPNLKSGVDAVFTATVTDVRGLATSATATLPLLADTGKPVIEAIAPAPETTYHLNDRYTIQANVSDVETGVASVDFTVDGSTYHVTTSTGTSIRTFTSPQITVPAKNVDTRIPISVVANDYQGNSTTRSFEVIYIGVNDPSLPKGAWLCPLDRAVIPANQTAFVLPLRMRATDDIAVTSVQFRVPGVIDPIPATRVSATDEYQATATINTPAAGSELVATGVVNDADSTHTIELPIAIDVVAFDTFIDGTQAVTVDNVSQFTGKSVLVRGAAGRLVTHVPLTLAELAVIDGARVESLGTTTTKEQRVDITVAQHLYVDCASSIDVTGRGYLGGYGVNPDGSNTRNESPLGRTVGNTPTGGASNAGGTHAGLASEAAGGATNAVHGSLTDPADLGSGGSGNTFTPGAPGGGAVSLMWTGAPEDVGRVVIAGAVRADGGGGAGFFRSGSGGSVRLRGRHVIVGPGAHLAANGGVAPPSDGTGVSGAAGGGGRIAISATERLDVATSQLESHGGALTLISYPYLEPGAGTIFLRRPGQTSGELLIASYPTASETQHFVRATPLGHIGAGTATSVLSSSLTDESRTFDPSAVGEELILGSDTTRSYAVTEVSADGHTLLTDGADGDLTAAGSSSYRGLLPFDRVQLGPYALARFDESFAIGESIDDPPAAVRDATATILRYTDVPSVSVTTTPVAGDVIRATSIDVAIDAASIAGLRSKTIQFSAAANAVTGTFPAYPTSVSDSHTAVPVPAEAALGTATMVVSVVDRADRAGTAAAQNFTVVDNQPPAVTAFTAAPLSLYPGHAVTATVSARDDVAVTRLTVTSQITGDTPSTQTITPNAKIVTDQVFTVPVPLTAPGNSTLSIEAAVEDGFPGRMVPPQAITVEIRQDTAPPAVTINSPNPDQLFNEGTGLTIPVRVIAADADVAVQGVTVQVGSAASVSMTIDASTPNGWKADVPVPGVEGSDPVPMAIVVTATDFEANAATATRQILVVPLYDPNAPVVRFLCPTAGGMFPPGYAAKLRVFALGNDIDNPNNGVASVQFFVDGSATPIDGSPVAGVANAHEAIYTLPSDAADGRLFTVRAVVTNVSNLQSEATSEFNAVTGTVMTSDTTVNDASLDNQSIIVKSGTLTLGGNRTFTRLIVLDGAKVTHAQGSQLTMSAGQTFVSCTGAIDVNGKGYGSSASYPGASIGTGNTGGSHIGRGGSPSNETSGSTYGSVYTPQEAGAGGVNNSGTAGGGVTRISAGTLTVDGAIRTNGVGVTRAGAGGSIWITAGKINGTGTIEANGAGASEEPGGGGAVAIEYSDATSVMPPVVRALGGLSSCCIERHAAAGSVYIKGPGAIDGELTVDNGTTSSNQRTELPSLGHGVAQSGTSGATLVTDRANNIPPYFAGHWVEITTTSGTPKGTWRIGTIVNKTVTLVPNNNEPIAIEGGDLWQGIYRLDNLKLRKTTLITADRLVVMNPFDLDVSSTILGNNQGPPVLNAARISLQPSATGASVIGTTGAASDPDTPITAIAINGRTGATFAGPVGSDGSFAVGVQGNAGDAIAVKARDSNMFPLDSVPISIGTLSADTPLPAQLDKSAWTSESAFKPQTIKLDGRILAVASSYPDGARSDKLVALDASDPARPVFSRTVATAGPILDIDLRDGWAFIAGDRFTTVDLKSPTSTLNFANSDPCGREQAIAVSGAFAFTSETDCANNGRIFVYDISDPSAPRALSSSDTAGVANHSYSDLLPYGTDYLVGISPSGSGLDVVVIDRRQPAVLQKVSSLAISNITAWRGRISGSLLYLANDAQAEMVVVDITNPSAPSIAGRLPLPAGAGGVLPLGDTALVPATVAGLVTTTTDPAQLAVTGSIGVGGSAYDVAASSGYAYVANEVGMAVVPLSVPPIVDQAKITFSLGGTIVTVTGAYRAITGQAPISAEVKNTVTGASMTVTVSADGSFTAAMPASAGDPMTVKATDAIGRVAGPVSIGTVPFGSSTTTLPNKANDASFRARAVKVEGNLAVVGGYPLYNTSSDKLVVYDISNPAAPVQSRVVQAGAGPMLDFELRDGWAYVVGDRFTTIDLKNPASARTFANADPCGVEEAVAVSGGYAFTAEAGCANNGRIFVYDVTNPAAPIYLGNQDVAGFGNHFFTDLIAYGTDYLIGLSTSGSQRDVMVIDRRDPNNLRKVSELQLLSELSAFRGKLVGTTLYIAGLEQGVAMVDVSNPSSPRLMSSIDTPGLATGIDVSGSTVMVADRGDGVAFLDSSTGTLRMTGAQVTGGDAFDVALGGANLYVANELGLFVIFNVVAPPDIEVGFIGVTQKDATTATVAGAALAVGGQKPLSVVIRNDSAGSSAPPVAANADGSFIIDVPAQSGARLSIAVTDALGRIASLRLGSVPFVTVVFDLPAHDTDLNFYSRRVVTDGTNAILSAGTINGTRLTSSGRAFVYKAQPAPNPPALTMYNTGVAIDDAEIVSGHTFFGADRLAVLNYAAASPTHFFANNDPCGREIAVAVIGTRAYTAEADCSNNGTLFIYDATALVNDATSTASPTFIRSQAIASASGIVYRDLIPYGTSYLFAISPDANRDVTIIDVTNPSSLVRLKELDIPNFTAFSTALDGTTLYLAGGDAGVAIVDVGNLSTPLITAVIDTPGIARSVAVLNSAEIVVADASGSGLTFIDTSNRATPVILGSQPLRGNPVDVKVSAGLIWVATETRFVVLRP